MSIEDRIVYSGNDLIQALEESLDRIKVFTFDGRYAMLLGEDIVEKIRQWDKTIRRQKDLPLTLTVCGEFKRGKSSLINAILEEDVVTTNITTETITTNKIRYGTHKNELLLAGGRRVGLSDEELQRDHLKTILAELPERASEMELRRPIDMLQQLAIIDTPGLGDAMEDYLTDVRKALQQTDVVVYVFSSLYPLSVQEQLFIKNAIKPQKHTRLLLVSNFADSFEDEAACDRVVEVIKDRLSTVLPGETPFMLSALDERCRQLGTKRPNAELEAYLENNFLEFRNTLSELLEEKKEHVIPNRIHRLISGMTDELNMLLDAQMQGLTLSHEEIAQKAAELETYKKNQAQQQESEIARVHTLIERSKGDTIRWLDAMISDMERQVEQLRKYSVQDVKENYAMYCTETIQAATDRCIDKFLAELYDLLDDVSDSVSNAFSLAGVSTAPSFKFALHNKSWTKGDNVALVTNMVLSSSWLGYITDFVAGTMRRREIKQSMPDVIKEIAAQYTGLRLATFNAVNDVYAEIQKNVSAMVAAHFNEQVASLEAQLEQAAAISRQSDQKKEEIKAAALALRSVLKEICEDLSVPVLPQDA